MSIAPEMVPVVGTKIVVTGGCGGIGQALVAACDELGLDVVVLDLPQSIEKSKKFVNVKMIEMDGSKPSQLGGRDRESRIPVGRDRCFGEPDRHHEPRSVR